MNPTAQQTTLDNALVALGNRVKIGKCNMRIIHGKNQKEHTYQVVLDAFALSPLYPAFLFTAKVPEIYIQQFRLSNQEFVEPPNDEEIASFIKELGYKGDLISITTNSSTYKTFLAYATGAIPPKKARKFEKHVSPSKKKTHVIIEEPAKKPVSTRLSTGAQIRDTLGVSMLKKKAPAKTDRSKVIDLLSQAALLEEAQMKKAIQKSKRETNIHQVGGSGDGAVLELKVPDEPKGNDDDDDDQEDDEECDHINKEMYSDENVELKDTELESKRKDDEEITDTGHVDAEHENVNQEVTGDQVKDDAQETVTADPATQKTQVPLPSSSISSDYATKFLNFDNIPLVDTEIISMLEIKVQHEDLSIQTSPLLVVPVAVIPKPSVIKPCVIVIAAPITTIPITLPPFFSTLQQSAAIPKPTTTEATTLTITIPESITPSAIHQRVSELEKEVKILKNKQTLFETMNKTKSFNKYPKHKALYHALMEFIHVDEEAFDRDVADKLKKRKPDDADRDEDPPAGSDQGLQIRKTSKDDEPSKKIKSTDTSKGITKS
nr:hypothetical protein [Tanacetum cinerariifolium]